MSFCLTQTSHIGSSKFGFISSESLVKTLENKGFKLSDVIESKIRKDKEKRLGFQKHVLRFDVGYSTSQGKLQLLAINSHEGSSALTFRLGFFRMVCSNGLIIGSDLIPKIKVRHTQNGLLKLDDSIEEMMDYRTVAIDGINKMSNKILTGNEIKALQDSCLKLRMGDKYSDKLIPLFEAKRWEDKREDLFSQFNIIQENLMRTGFYVQDEDKNKTSKVRAIKGVDANILLNTSIYNEALKLIA